MTIIASARVPGITSLDRDDTDQIARITEERPCPPWCTRHVDSTTHPGDIDPGAANHFGDEHSVTILDGYPGREAEYRLSLRLQQYDGAPGRTDEPQHAYLSTPVDGKLNAAGLRQLASAALVLAAQLSPADDAPDVLGAYDTGRRVGAETARQSSEALTALLDAAFRLGRKSDRDQPASEALLFARIDAGPMADPWFAAGQLAAGHMPPSAVVEAMKALGGGS